MRNIHLSDGGESIEIDALGAWATFAYDLGYQTFSFDDETNRIVTVVSVPDRTIFSILLALGCVVGDASLESIENQLTWSQFIKLPNGTTVHFSDGDRVRSGVLADLDSSIPDCRWANTRGKGSSRHSFLKFSYAEKNVSLVRNKVPAVLDARDRSVIQFLSELGHTKRESWLKTVYPMTVISTIKHRFSTAVHRIRLELEGGGSGPLSSVLEISENGEPGSGKLLLKSERANDFLSPPKAVILNTRKFEETVREYSFANLAIVLEHHEYDEYTSSLVQRMRASGSDLPTHLQSFNQAPAGVKSCSMLLKRYPL